MPDLNKLGRVYVVKRLKVKVRNYTFMTILITCTIIDAPPPLRENHSNLLKIKTVNLVAAVGLEPTTYGL
jgi:hypothetical protein